MSRNKQIRLVVLPVLLVGLSACADYLNHYDTVTLAAGNAQAHNLMLQRTEPFNPDSEVTWIPGDGQRTADVVKKYRTSQAPGAPAPTDITVNVTQ